MSGLQQDENHRVNPRLIPMKFGVDEEAGCDVR